MDPARLAWTGAILGCVIGILGGATGTYFGIKNTKGPKERAFVIKLAVVGWVTIVIFLALLILLPVPYNFLVWLPYGILLPLGIRYANRKQQEIRKLENK